MSERVIARARRLKIIPNAFGEKAVLKLMYGAMIHAAERWRGPPVTDFKRGVSSRPSRPSSTPSNQARIGRPAAAPTPKASSTEAP